MSACFVWKRYVAISHAMFDTTDSLAVSTSSAFLYPHINIKQTKLKGKKVKEIQTETETPS